MSLHIDPSQWRLKTPNGIPYKLVDGYPKGSFAVGNTKFSEKCIIRSSDLFAFVLETLPQTVEWSNGIWNFTSGRTCPGTVGLLAAEVTSEPFDPGKPVNLANNDLGASSNTYAEFTQVEIRYEPFKRDPSGDDSLETFLEVDADFNAEFISVDTAGGNVYRENAVAMLDDDHQTTINAGQLVPVREIKSHTTRILPTVDWNVKFPKVTSSLALRAVVLTARNCQGHINSAAMPLFLNAEAGTILLKGFSVGASFSWKTDGTVVPQYQLGLKFNEKRVWEDDIAKGHNYVYQPASGHFERIVIKNPKTGGTKYLYDSANLNAIWA
jgi:hypothetical protein